MPLPAFSKRLQAIQAAAIAAILLAGIVDAAASGGGSNDKTAAKPSVTPSASPSPTTAPGEIVLFTDDFDVPGIGWAEDKTKSGSSFGYVHGNYVVVLKDRFSDEFLYAPATPARALQADLTAAQTAGFSTAAGFGMVCTQRNDRTQVSYDFILVRLSASRVHWFIRFRDGPPNKSRKETILTKGDLALAIGPRMIKIRTQCLTKPDDRTTNLVFSINGRIVSHAHSTFRTDLPVGSWRSGIVVTNGTGSTTVTATHFAMSSVAGAAPLP
jgi:hypothetical protein